MSMKNSIDTIGNRTCDLLACSVVPQTAASLRAPVMGVMNVFSVLVLIYSNKYVHRMAL
jgi:hypothetical protein